MAEKILVLTASPRKEGNTNALVKAFCDGIDEINAEREGKEECEYEIFDLCRADMKSCTACRHCQRSTDIPGCIQGDDEIFEKVLRADLIVLATPVYSWFCTPPAKAFLDRCVYAMNKYYGYDGAEGPGIGRGTALMEGKAMALITTCGYPVNMGADLLEEGIKRYCRHSKIKYAGMLAEQHKGYDVPFMDDDKKAEAKAFAKSIAL